jgi:hypothetical protein
VPFPSTSPVLIPVPLPAQGPSGSPSQTQLLSQYCWFLSRCRSSSSLSTGSVSSASSDTRAWVPVPLKYQPEVLTHIFCWTWCWTRVRYLVHFPSAPSCSPAHEAQLKCCSKCCSSAGPSYGPSSCPASAGDNQALSQLLSALASSRECFSKLRPSACRWLPRYCAQC